MSEIQSSLISSHLPSLLECGHCLKKILFTYRGTKTPIHHPLTGDVICGECKQDYLPSSSQSQLDSHKWIETRFEALPLYLRSERKKVEGVGVANEPNYDRCINHPHTNWMSLDLEGLNCLCLTCSKGQLYQTNPQSSLKEAATTIATRLASVTATPLIRQDIPSLDRNRPHHQGERRKIAEEEFELNVNLLQGAWRMSETAEALLDWLVSVESISPLISGKISQLRFLLVKNKVSHQQFDMGLGDVESQFQHVCLLLRKSLSPLIRQRQVISASLIEGMRLLGIDVKGTGYLTKDKVYRIVCRGPRDEWNVGEEVMIKKTLSTLRNILENGDPLFIELDKKDVKEILNQPQGLSQVIDDLKWRVETVSSLKRGRKGEIALVMDEAKGIRDDVMKVVHLLSQVCHPDYWMKSLIEWRLGDPEGAFQACLDALLNEDLQHRSLTFRTLRLLDRTKVKVDEGKALLLEGICLYHREPQATNVVKGFHFLESEERGCDHPLLYWHLGELYRQGVGGLSKDAIKASEYYTKCIQGEYHSVYLFSFILFHSLCM